MGTDDSRVLDAIAAVTCGEAAEKLLDYRQDAAMVRGLAIRADELRVDKPLAALGVAEAALKALRHLPLALQRPGLGCVAWAVYGSILRRLSRLEESEIAIVIAASLAPMSRPQVRADLRRRLAYLRAVQGNAREARLLVRSVLRYARCCGSRTLGKELVNAGAILMLIKDYRGAEVYLGDSVKLLPANGDKHHISAVCNLANCRLELSSTPADLSAVLRLTRKATGLIEADSSNELQLRWLDGKIHHRLGRLDESLELLESVRQGIDERGDGYDRALRGLDLAELHLDRGDSASAQALARSSFGILSVLRKDVEAYKAMRIFYDAGVTRAVDRATVHSVRQQILEFQRRPRPPA